MGPGFPRRQRTPVDLGQGQGDGPLAASSFTSTRTTASCCGSPASRVLPCWIDLIWAIETCGLRFWTSGAAETEFHGQAGKTAHHLLGPTLALRRRGFPCPQVLRRVPPRALAREPRDGGPDAMNDPLAETHDLVFTAESSEHRTIGVRIDLFVAVGRSQQDHHTRILRDSGAAMVKSDVA